MNDLDIQRLRDLARSNDLLPLDRQLLRDAANAIERTLNPVPLRSRSEFRCLYATPEGTDHWAPVCRSRREAREWAVQANTSSTRSNRIIGMEYRTVVESDWRPTHV